jgi:hypothetical protein
MKLGQSLTMAVVPSVTEVVQLGTGLVQKVYDGLGYRGGFKLSCCLELLRLRRSLGLCDDRRTMCGHDSCRDGRPRG